MKILAVLGSGKDNIFLDPMTGVGCLIASRKHTLNGILRQRDLGPCKLSKAFGGINGRMFKPVWDYVQYRAILGMLLYSKK